MLLVATDAKFADSLMMYEHGFMKIGLIKKGVTFWKCLQTGLVPFMVLVTLVLIVWTGAACFVIARGVDMNTEGSSLIGRFRSSNSRWNEAALIRVIRSLPL